MSPEASAAAAHRLAAQLGVSVAASFGSYIRHLSDLLRNNPRPANEIFSSPGLSDALTRSISIAHAQASALVTRAWTSAGGGPEDSPALDVLRGEVAVMIGDLRGQIEGIVREQLGTPAADPVTRITDAVGDAVQSVVTRARMSVEMAASVSRTEAVIAEGHQLQRQGQHVMKVWRSRLSRRTCRWCRELDGVMVPLDDDFPHGDPVALEQERTRRVATPAGARRYRRSMGQPIIFTHPPRVWLGRLPGPKRHPRCECWLELHILTEAGTPPQPLRSEEASERMYVRASDIAELPEPQYLSLMAFLRAATHELGQVLRRLKGL
jgi:hypothetical protein